MPSREHRSHAETRRTRRGERHIPQTSAISASPREPFPRREFLLSGSAFSARAVKGLRMTPTLLFVYSLNHEMDARILPKTMAARSSANRSASAGGRAAMVTPIAGGLLRGLRSPALTGHPPFLRALATDATSLRGIQTVIPEAAT